MTKYIVIFVIFFILGIVAVFCYFELLVSKPGSVIFQNASSSPTPAKTDFSLENAPSESLKGKISKMLGSVSWQSRTATESAQITSPVEIQQGERLETENGHVSVTFANAVQVDINDNSSIDFIQTLPISIVLSQSKGSVNYLKIGNLPISARVLHLLVEVEGKVKIALDDTKPVVTLSVAEGEATVAYNNLNYQTQTKTFSKGETFVFNDRTRKGVLK